MAYCIQRLLVLVEKQSEERIEAGHSLLELLELRECVQLAQLKIPPVNFEMVRVLLPVEMALLAQVFVQ